VRGFMKGDGDDHRNDPDRRQIHCVGAHRFDVLLMAVLFLGQPSMARQRYQDCFKDENGSAMSTHGTKLRSQSMSSMSVQTG
jgi:hypothetical protein